MNKFKFHPVGQGLFYTGSIASGTYNFVYDCGTESKGSYLSNAIDNYVDEISVINKKPTIDFVVISHLHTDHFNGLYELSKQVKIEKLYLPYLGEDNLVKKIVLYNELVLNRQEDNDIESARMAYNFAIRLYTTRDGIFENILEVDFLSKNAESYDEKGFCYSKYEDKITIGTKDYWKFVFVNKTISNDKIKELLDNLKREINDFGNKSFEEIIELNGGIEAIGTAYKNTFGYNQNITSTLLYHYPAYDTNLWLRRVSYLRKCSRCCDLNNVIFGCRETLLTGDAEFPKKFIEELEKLIKIGLLNQRIGMLQVPHHGAEKNWKDFSVLNINADYYVIPYGNKNSYGHPSNITVGQIFKSNKKLISVNDNKSFEYYIG